MGDEEYSNDNDDLDVSWVHENERLQDIQKNYCREPMPNIDLYFIYINCNLYIDKIICEKQVLEIHNNNIDSILKKEVLLKLIQSKKKTTPCSKYKIIDVLTYNVILEPEHIQSYAKTENLVEKSAGFFKVLPIIDDIVISPSIFLFHSINAIYFIFQEIETEKYRNIVKSILKPIQVEPNIHSNKSTKKVRICVDNILQNNKISGPGDKLKTRTTRRNIPKI